MAVLVVDRGHVHKGRGEGSRLQVRSRVSRSQIPSEPASPATVGRPSRLSNDPTGAAVVPAG